VTQMRRMPNPEDTALDVLITMYYVVRAISFDYGFQPVAEDWIEEPLSDDEATRQRVCAAIRDCVHGTVTSILGR
jgi:hypothetical protein